MDSVIPKEHREKQHRFERATTSLNGKTFENPEGMKNIINNPPVLSILMGIRDCNKIGGRIFEKRKEERRRGERRELREGSCPELTGNCASAEQPGGGFISPGLL
ncbi:hypothetical protein, partial [Anaerolinea sp.]|uniref:hypothetical protein n=1 Tax=Anaerolinea sp. TaxID=1872519 RepID=UPI002ACD5180